MTTAVTGGIIGLIMHHCLFIHGEWHIQAPDILLYHILCFYCLSWIFETAWWIIFGYLVALFSSICVYRLFFHRLNHFPGPVCARITKIWHMWKARTCQNHLVLEGLHQTYGDFVRTGTLNPVMYILSTLIYMMTCPGPSEITVFHPDVFAVIDGPRSECIKSEWYDLLHPNMSLVTARDKKTHTSRRRQWKYGLSAKGGHHKTRYQNLADRTSPGRIPGASPAFCRPTRLLHRSGCSRRPGVRSNGFVILVWVRPYG